ncbi:rieske 2Fe-2S domain protein, putative [Nostoc sp. NIES-3756]|uniref:Rieske (2Fe-2S) protein n=1 Tax=Nostoc sp. NIES-3756 TaxID=1751286 RepID=UPI00071F6625|nr:Rieske (2Fe-2S) protein [Nostoc sp. NIES-3756]BAT55848.1 rieske 2Fe-2S domain protein, putative [Nostoc sp. NIES-3756]BAY36390.1 putative rieske 2Fe-2S domain protein [Nostoc sp. NIES-2111]
MEPILPGAPWLIAHRSMLGINKPYKVTLNEHDYVLWQNQQGEVFALDNICPHMQAPLSDGWICEDTGTITCPFHALKFDGKGRLHNCGKVSGQPLLTPLDIIIKDDCIWTYGGYTPKIPIPDLISNVSAGMSFLGVAGEKSMRGTFLDSISINYDYNHQSGTHRDLFGIKANRIPLFEHDGYWAKVVQELDREDTTWNDILQNPLILTAPKTYTGTLEYAFPSLTTFRATFPIGEVLQVHVLYPETTTQTKTFVLVYSQPKHTVLKPLLGRFVLSAVATVVEQDTRAIETSYPRQPAKIRLPNEEIMFHAQKLYREW